MAQSKKDGRTRQRPKQQCPFCKYTCKGTQALGRHIRFKHLQAPTKDMAPVGKQELTTVMQQALDVIKQLPNTATIDKDGIPTMSPATLRALLEQDIRLRISCKIIASNRILRAMKLQTTLEKIDKAIAEKMTTTKLIDKSLEELQDMQVHVMKQLKYEVDMFKTIDLIRDDPDSEDRWIKEVLNMFKASGGEMAIIQTTIKSTPIASPTSRDNIRKLATALSTPEGKAVLEAELVKEDDDDDE